MKYVVWTLLLVVTTTGGAEAQEREFEVASVRPHVPSGSIADALAPIRYWPGGRFETTAPLRKVISDAYGLAPYQRVEGSAGVLDRYFQIAAKAPEGVQAGRDEMRAMVRALLADRFKLKIRFQDEVQTVWVLRPLGQNAPAYVPRAPTVDCAAILETVGTSAEDKTLSRKCRGKSVVNGQMTGVFSDMKDFAQFLSFLNRAQAVVDESGLSSAFEIDTKVDMASFNDRFPSQGLPSLSDMLRNEFGLRIVTERRPIPVLVVEHVEAPTEN